MNSLSIFGKYLDQPKLVQKFEKAVPAVLVAGGGLCAYSHIKNSPQDERKKEIIKSICVLGTTIGSALLAPRIADKFFKHSHHHHHGELKPIAEQIKDFVSKNPVSEKTAEYLEKAQKKVLSYKEVKTVFNEIGEHKDAKEFLSGDHGLIPDPENIDSAHIKDEIKRLSLFGLIPVVGGIAGGIFGDKLTEKNWKAKIPDKIKEGSYQYLANIVLCNVGAGAALAIMEKNNITSKWGRAVGMISGIILTGLIGGSAIANLIGKKIIDPILNKTGNKNNKELLFDERKPELLDVGLHVDDIATVAVLSGLKWIEPALPVLYAISGYRAGIGYRNGGHNHFHNHGKLRADENKQQKQQEKNKQIVA